VTFGTPLLAALGGLAVVVAAAICAASDLGRLFGRPVLWTAAARLIPAAAARLPASYAAVHWSTAIHYETALLRGAGGVLPHGRHRLRAARPVGTADVAGS
jgi:hypothetical protein